MAATTSRTASTRDRTPRWITTTVFWALAAGGAALLPLYPGLDGAHRVVTAAAVCVTVLGMVRRRTAMDDQRNADAILQLGQHMGAMQLANELAELERNVDSPTSELGALASLPTHRVTGELAAVVNLRQRR